MIAERKRFFAAQRAAKQRSKPPTKTQMRNIMCTYLKNMEKSSEKQSEESSKRQKMEDDAEKEELRAYLDIILGDNVAVSVELLATKYPIVDWKIHILSEDKMYYEIIRANGSTKSYKIFTEMLDDFDRQDVLDLYRLVKERFETTNPKGYDRLLWGDLITVFELKKTYLLTQEMLSGMLSGKLEGDNETEKSVWKNPLKKIRTDEELNAFCDMYGLILLEWDDEQVLFDDNEMVKVKVLMALADDEVGTVGKESVRNFEWVKISIKKCDIRKPIWYLDNGFSRHMTCVKSYLHKYVDQPGPKVVFGDDSTCRIWFSNM
ncbi:hypothetical protein Tco_1274501 [Tanacetum coccineum]